MVNAIRWLLVKPGKNHQLNKVNQRSFDMAKMLMTKSRLKERDLRFILQEFLSITTKHMMRIN